MKSMTVFLILAMMMAAGIASAKITLPPAETIKLDNGLTITVINRPALPLFSLKMSFHAGSIYDPPGQYGLANLTNELLTRGTSSRSAKEIAEEISFVGGTLNNYCDRENAGFQGEFLSENGEKGFEVLADILTQSAFAQSEIEWLVSRLTAQLQSRFEDPSTIATEKIFQAILGNNPYAHIPIGNEAVLGVMTREQVIGFFARVYTPDNCQLVVCGDISPQTVSDWAKKYFAGWKGKSNLPDVNAAFAPTNGREITIYDKADATQTQIRIGGPGLNMGSPDYIPFEAARTVYAGSFTSRLVNEIRVNRGLTYNVNMTSSRFLPGGVAFVSTFTKNQSVGEVLEIILNESRRIYEEPIPDSELTGAINYRCGLYPLSFETSDGIANAYNTLWFYDLDKSYYEDYQESFRSQTPESIIRLAAHYFPLDNYRVVLVGKADEIKIQAEKFGPVTIKPYTE